MTTTDGELKLFEMPEAGRLLAEHRELVLKLARLHHVRSRGLSEEDLVSEGNLGLLKAAAKFNPSRGARFSTYASYWIRQAMLRALDNKSRTVRLPWQSKAKLRKLAAAKAAFREAHGREADDAEIVQASGLSLRTLRGLRASCSTGVSFDAVIDTGAPGRQRSLFDSIPDPSAAPDEALASKDSREFFLRALSTLDKREAKIIELRFGLGKGAAEKTCESVGAQVGLSREGVRKIQERTLLKLRAIMLPEFIDSPRDAVAV